MNDQRQAYLLDLPLVAYGTALNLQRDCVTARRSGHLDHDLIIVVEHPPVFTMGRRGGKENLLVTEAELKAKGMEIFAVERGGDLTYHGPGQIIVYPIIDLNQAKLKVVELVDAMEMAMTRTAVDWGVRAKGDPLQRGAWVAGRKLGSLGITIRRGISFHGLALNLNTDLEPFSWINPCGIRNCTMTSLVRETGQTIPPAVVRNQLAGHLARVLGLSLAPVTLPAIEHMTLSP